MLKKTTLALLGLTCSGLAMAGTMGPVCAPGNVTIPCEQNKWDLGIDALYLKPSYGPALSYAPTATGSPIQKINPSDGWGYRMVGAWHFNTGNDITLNWSHYDVNSGAGTFAGQYLLLAQGRATLIPSTYGLHLDNKYDQVNLVMGQHVDFSMTNSARFYSGLQYADLRLNRTSHFAITNADILTGTGGGVRHLNNTDFNGVGPTLGMDYAYQVMQGLSLTANTAGSLVYGSSRYNFATAYDNGFVASSAYGSKKTMVTSLEAKLGANYAWQVAQGLLNLEGGYQVVNYFNALQARPLTTGALHTSDFGLYGPYFGVKWSGNA